MIQELRLSCRNPEVSSSICLNYLETGKKKFLKLLSVSNLLKEIEKLLNQNNIDHAKNLCPLWKAY